MTKAMKQILLPFAVFGGIALGLAVAVLYFFPAIWDPFGLVERRARTSCGEDHLQAMHRALLVYVAQFGNRCDPPPHRGAAFWLCLGGRCGEPEKHAPGYAAQAPLAGKLDVLLCPACSGDRLTDYLGPRPYPSPGALPSICPPGHPIAADKPANHKGAGGNVLFYNGIVEYMEGAKYEEALKKLE
jgi:hypothetical protein